MASTGSSPVSPWRTPDTPLKNPPVPYTPPSKKGYRYDPASKSWVEEYSVISSSTLNSLLGATAAGSMAALVGDMVAKGSVKAADLLTNGGTSEALRDIASGVAPSGVQLPESFTLPASSGFNFNPENSPPLFAGLMQSSEMIALSIGSLTQIVADNHLQHMQVLAAQVQFESEAMGRQILALESIAASLLVLADDTKNVTVSDAIKELGFSSSDALNAVASAVSSKEPVSVQEFKFDPTGIVNALSNLIASNGLQMNELKTSVDGLSTSFTDSSSTVATAISESAFKSPLLEPLSLSLSDSLSSLSYAVSGALQTVSDSVVSSARPPVDLFPVVASLNNLVYTTQTGTDKIANSNASQPVVENHINFDLAPVTSALEEGFAAQTESSDRISANLSKVSDWAVLAKTRESFLQTPKTVLDSDGDFVASALSPLEIQAQKDAQHLKNLDSQNTYKVDESDFPIPQNLPILPFRGREEIFNFAESILPVNHKSIS